MSHCCKLRYVLFTQPADTADAYVDQLNDVLAELLDKAAPVQTRRRRPQKLISGFLPRPSTRSASAVVLNDDGVLLVPRRTDLNIVVLAARRIG